jgi:hypothetical protein
VKAQAETPLLEQSIPAESSATLSYEAWEQRAIAQPTSPSPTTTTPADTSSPHTSFPSQAGGELQWVAQPTHPDDYLESSEHLLQSLAAEEEQAQAERTFMNSLVTPMGLGSLVLLLLSSAMFGYLLMNPSSLARLWRGASESSAPLTTNPSTSQSSETNPQPNLAGEEFPDLNLDSLGTLKAPTTGTTNSPQRLHGKPASQPKVTEKPAAKAEKPATSTPAESPSEANRTPLPPAGETPLPATTAPTETAPPVVEAPPAKPAATAPKPATKPAPSSPKPATAPSSVPIAPKSASHGYKVVIPYEGDRSLEAARKVSPDAYMRNFQDGTAKVQVGAYGTAADAEARVQELRKQGISAEVYQP